MSPTPDARPRARDRIPPSCGPLGRLGCTKGAITRFAAPAYWKFESIFLQRRVSNEPSAGDLPEARRQTQCSLQKNGSTFSTSANQAECPMRLFWLHLADLFLGITTVAQFGFLGLSNNERHPGFRLLTRRYRGLENPLRVIADIIELDFCQNCRSGRLLGVGRRLDDRGFFSPGIFLKSGGLRLWLPAPGSESPRGRLGRTRPETFARRTRPSSRPLRRPRSAGGPRHQQVSIVGSRTAQSGMSVQTTTMMTKSVIIPHLLRVVSKCEVHDVNQRRTL